MRGKVDKILLFSVAALVVIGLVFVYSASFYTAELSYGNRYFFLIKQLTGAIVGAVALTVMCFVKVDLLKRFYIVGVIVSVVLLALVFVPGIGVENYGAKRWIGFGSFSFQPSEIAKFAFVLFSACHLSGRLKGRFTSYIPTIVVGGVFCLLIIAEPNMSVTMCMGGVMMSMLFVGGMKGKHFAAMIVPCVALVPVLILMEPYRLLRLLAFLDPWASPKDEGYQLIQSLYALGSGGFFGVGLFNSRQKYRFLPFAESDFIFSVIGEETGVFGCLIVMTLFCIVIWRGVRIAVNARDRFRCYLASGITAVIAIQTMINFAVVTGSIPPTGLPLPFISYGGTSLVVFMTAIGVLLALSRENNCQGNVLKGVQIEI
ncbi:MAG TPA: putative lipid II flippase FtsW [Candidatus Limihabitans stercoravium]|nr:putative lipid II flippase FtsW [Candidatus Limihabitans stercoravium]